MAVMRYIMRIRAQFQVLFWCAWLYSPLGLLASGCGGHDAYAVVQIIGNEVMKDAQVLCILATVGSLNARYCYSNVPAEVSFWLPFGTLHLDSEQKKWIGEMVTVKAEVINSKNCVVATGMDNKTPTYQQRLDLRVILMPQRTCSP